MFAENSFICCNQKSRSPSKWNLFLKTCSDCLELVPPPWLEAETVSCWNGLKLKGMCIRIWSIKTIFEFTNSTKCYTCSKTTIYQGSIEDVENKRKRKLNNLWRNEIRTGNNRMWYKRNFCHKNQLIIKNFMSRLYLILYLPEIILNNKMHYLEQKRFFNQYLIKNIWDLDYFHPKVILFHGVGQLKNKIFNFHCRSSIWLYLWLKF